MEQLENPAYGQGSEAEQLDSLFNKYKERDEKKKKFLSKEEILAKYFNPRKDTEIFRALPKRPDEELIEEGYFHKVQAGKYLSNTTAVYCPAKNNPKVQAKDKEGNLQFEQDGVTPVMVEQYCPLCAKSRAIRSKMNKSISGKKKEQLSTPQEHEIFESNKNILKRSSLFEAKLYYIIRGIDRGAEKDGVKFWRFKHNFKGQGVHDKLWKPIIQQFYKQTGKLYSDLTQGVDLMISVVDNEFNGRKFKDVSAITPRIPQSVLHSDEMIMKQWLSDKLTWREVFKPKKAPGITELQYLQLASEERETNQKFDMRNTPYYDEEAKKWVFPNHADLEEAANTKNKNLDADSTDQYDLPDDDGYVSAATNVVNQSSQPDITQMSSAAPTNNAPSNLGALDLSTPTNTTQKSGAYDDLPF
jgi:hypothetical protein